MDTKENKQAILVGAFLLIGLVVFLVGVFFLGGQQKTFSKNFHVNTVFDDVQGLKKGNNVWFSGVKVGTISDIRFSDSAMVKVRMNIDQAVQQYIHRNANARISSDGLIGNKIIVIDGGSPQAPMVQDGDVLQSAKLVSTDDMMKTLQVNLQNLSSITGDFKLLSRKILQGKGTVGTLMADSLMGIQLRKSMANLESTTSSAARMATQLEQFTKKVNTKGGLADNLLTDTTVFSRAKKAVNQLQLAATSAKEFADNLNQASAKLKSNDNAIGVLLNDPATAGQLRNTVTNLQKSSVLLNEDLKAAQSNFLLRGYFKDLAKAKADSIKKANKK